MRYGLIALAFLAVMTQGASAGDKPAGFQPVSCTLIRFYVARYSADAAEAWAQSKGAAEAEIDNARRCLPAGAAHTASVLE